MVITYLLKEYDNEGQYVTQPNLEGESWGLGYSQYIDFAHEFKSMEEVEKCLTTNKLSPHQLITVIRP